MKRKMKILYSADVHGDFDALDKFIDYASSLKDIDIVVCAGDLAGQVLKEEPAEKLVHAGAILNNIRETNKVPAPLRSLAEHMRDDEKCPAELKQAAEDYLQLYEVTKSNMLSEYKKIKDKFSKIAVPVLTIPGNHDTSLEGILEEEDLHLKSREIKGVRFAGYGGADIIPIWMPEELVIPFREGWQGFTFFSEPYGFLSKEDPDVALVHMPPLGACDVVNKNHTEDAKGEKHVGSQGIEAYILQESPNLVLSGHIHEAIGVERLGRSYVINPGNLGRFYDQEQGYGTFMELELDEVNDLAKATLLKIKPAMDKNASVIEPIAEYIPKDNGIEIKYTISSAERSPEQESKIKNKSSEKQKDKGDKRK